MESFKGRYKAHHDNHPNARRAPDHNVRPGVDKPADKPNVKTQRRVLPAARNGRRMTVRAEQHVMDRATGAMIVTPAGVQVTQYEHADMGDTPVRLLAPVLLGRLTVVQGKEHVRTAADTETAQGAGSSWGERK